MAQGGLKNKFSAVPPKTKGKPAKKKRPLGPRKGGHYIAPKKGKRVQADRIRREISKQIDKGIEQAIHQQAVAEGNEFRVLQNTPSTSSSVQKKK